MAIDAAIYIQYWGNGEVTARLEIKNKLRILVAKDIDFLLDQCKEQINKIMKEENG